MYQQDGGNIQKSVDKVTVVIYIILMLCGWVSIYGASYQYGDTGSIFDFSGRAGFQLIWIGTALILSFIILKLDHNLFDVLAYYIYIAFILLLLLTIFIAPDIKGSHSWIVITPWLRLQPAEFAKFGVALALAKYLSTYNFKLLTLKSLSTIFVLISLPIVLILLQKETGSALVFTVFILVLYRVGLPSLVLIIVMTVVLLFVVGLKYSNVELGILTMGEFLSIIIILFMSTGMIAAYGRSRAYTFYAILGSIVLLGLPYFISTLDVNVNWGTIGLITLISLVTYLIVLAVKNWSKVYLLIAIFAIGAMLFISSINYIFNNVMQPHQQMRIKVTLGMEDDLMGAGYNVNQSIIAIGSGGLLGKGFLNGTQTKLKYVPEQDTDFIFCTVGEEQGFVGSVVILLLFGILILRLIYLAERQKNTFSLIYGYCVACIFLFHITINIGMVIGLTPVIGIPLPFFSYGGSSLWGFTILLFIFLRLDMTRKNR